MSGYSILYLLPRNLLSFLTGKLVLVKRPAFLAGLAARIFARLVGINMNESKRPLESFSCIGELFTRELKPGIRPIQAALVSPVDGVHRESGAIAAGRIPQVKGKEYTVKELLGDSEFAGRFVRGSYSNLYLSPRHYHRVHAPLSGQIVAWSYIPGTLWPVNDWSLNRIDRLFCVNERIVTYIQSDQGLVALVMVGATNVGKMSVGYNSFVSNQNPLGKAAVQHATMEQPFDIAAGDELGVFHLGSTVVLLFEQVQDFLPGPRVEVHYGQSLLR